MNQNLLLLISQLTGARSKWMDDYLLSMDGLVGRMGHRACRRLIVAHGLEGGHLHPQKLSEDHTCIHNNVTER